jgi:membrane-bound lytic murein transglycosylase B
MMFRPVLARPAALATLMAGLSMQACAEPAPAPAPAAAPAPAPAAPPPAPGKNEFGAYGMREDVVAFARGVAQRQPQLDLAWITQTLAQARFVPDVARLIMPPAENTTGTARSWNAYRSRAVDAARVRGGVAFWNEHQRWLDAAHKRYGVPPEIVVGILGVETLFGRQTGNFRVLDALATLSFNFPVGRRDRSEYFRSELENFLVLARREGADPLALKGSYAGAMGWPQFMPGSWLKYAVDFDGDGRIDLHANVADVIGSIAHYLAFHGWQGELPTHFDVVPPADATQRAALLGPDILPTFTAAQFAERGAGLSEPGQRHEGLLALIELKNADAPPVYVAGTMNFYVITRYNWSSYYAMAIIELGRTVATVREALQRSGTVGGASPRRPVGTARATRARRR